MMIIGECSMMTPSNKDHIMYAAFMMEGLIDLKNVERYSELIAKWGNGCYELIDCMTDYIPFLERLVNDYINDGVEYPGILEYEVCNPFGSWFGEEVMRTGELPIELEAHAKLADLVKNFFEDGMLA